MDHPYSQEQLALILCLAMEPGVTSIGFVGVADEELLKVLVTRTTAQLNVFDYSDQWGAGKRFSWEEGMPFPSEKTPEWFGRRVKLFVEGVDESDLFIVEVGCLDDAKEMEHRLFDRHQARIVFLPERWPSAATLPPMYDWEFRAEGTVARLNGSEWLLRDLVAAKTDVSRPFSLLTEAEIKRLKKFGTARQHG